MLFKRQGAEQYKRVIAAARIELDKMLQNWTKEEIRQTLL